MQTRIFDSSTHQTWQHANIEKDISEKETD